MVFIVENEPFIASLITRIAERAGRRTHHAPSLADATIALAQAHEFNLVLLDVELDDGLSHSWHAEHGHRLAGTRVVAMSGNWHKNRAAAEHYDRHGIARLDKPFTLEELTAVLTAT